MTPSRRACLFGLPALALGLAAWERGLPVAAAQPKPLQPVTPETAALSDAPALNSLWAAWQSNAAALVAQAKRRRWTLGDVARQPGAIDSDLRAFEGELGQPLPSQLRWAVQRARFWAFEWQTRDHPLKRVHDGGALMGVGAIWAINDDLLAQFRFWRQHHEQFVADDPAALAKHRALWARHVPFCAMENGDLLTIDARGDDPARQLVRYYCHEGYNGPHEEVLAPDFFSFISRWSAIGFLDLERFLMQGNHLTAADPASLAFHNWVNGVPTG